MEAADTKAEKKGQVGCVPGMGSTYWLSRKTDLEGDEKEGVEVQGGLHDLTLNLTSQQGGSWEGNSKCLRELRALRLPEQGSELGGIQLVPEAGCGSSRL